VITGLTDAAAVEGVEITHAGTAATGGEVMTAGGRVLNVTGIGSTPAQARERAYTAAGMIEFHGKQMRSDIGARPVAALGATAR
jgi:phosphoribosylamine--glycine ligase